MKRPLSPIKTAGLISWSRVTTVSFHQVRRRNARQGSSPGIPSRLADVGRNRFDGVLGHGHLVDKMTVRRRARKILIAERWRDRRIHIPILELKGRVPIETQHDGGEQRAAGTRIEMRSHFFVVGNALQANHSGPMESSANRDAIVDVLDFEQAGAARRARRCPRSSKDPE